MNDDQFFPSLQDEASELIDDLVRLTEEIIDVHISVILLR